MITQDDEDKYFDSEKPSTEANVANPESAAEQKKSVYTGELDY